MQSRAARLVLLTVTKRRASGGEPAQHIVMIQTPQIENMFSLFVCLCPVFFFLFNNGSSTAWSSTRIQLGHHQSNHSNQRLDTPPLADILYNPRQKIVSNHQVRRRKDKSAMGAWRTTTYLAVHSVLSLGRPTVLQKVGDKKVEGRTTK